jgi:Rrf2 family nitric oxide-sensitive transcriptional repressor
MRLLASTDIALRLLMLLAEAPEGAPLNVEGLAERLGGLSRNHLHKIVQNLTALGATRTMRGAGGGVVLAVRPDQLRVGSIIRSLEADQALVECFCADGGRCVLTPRCGLRGMLRVAQENFYHFLDGHTLADCLKPAPRRRA